MEAAVVKAREADGPGEGGAALCLRVRGATVAYSTAPAGRAPVLRGVSAGFHAGRVTVVAGPNGAGKSTLLRACAGLLACAEGEVLLEGRGVRAFGARERARRLAFLAQRPEVAFAFRVREVVAWGGVAFAGEPGRVEEAAREALRRVDLVDKADEVFGTLSAGQQQRAMLARALTQAMLAQRAGAPLAAVLADEPVSAMDPAHALLALEVLAELARTGVGVVVVLHDLGLAARWAQRGVLLAEGAVAHEGDAAEVFTPALLERVFGVRYALARDGEGGEEFLVARGRGLGGGASRGGA